MVEIKSSLLNEDEYLKHTKESIIAVSEIDHKEDFRVDLVEYINDVCDNNDDAFFYNMMQCLLFLNPYVDQQYADSIAFTTPEKLIFLNAPNKHIGENVRQWEFTYCHECLHQLWDTFEVGKRIQDEGIEYNHTLLNVVSDCIINHYLRDIRKKEGFPNGIYPEYIKDQFGIDYDPKVDTQYTLYMKCLEKKKEILQDPLIKDNTEFDDKIKAPIKNDGGGGGGGPQGPQEAHSDEYKRGWREGIKDVLDKKVDPLTYKPKEPKNDYDQGYNDVIAQIKYGLENGISLSDDNSGSGDSGSDLADIPWDIPNQGGGSGSSDESDKKDSKDGGSGDSGDNDSNDSNDSDKNNDSKSDSKDGKDSKSNDSKAGGGNDSNGSGSDSPSDSDIDKMSGDGAASSASDMADKAQKAADKAKEKAAKSGKDSDKTNADKAQEAADKAKEAAEKAKGAAKKGDEKGAKEAAKEARDAKDVAEEFAEGDEKDGSKGKSNKPGGGKGRGTNAAQNNVKINIPEDELRKITENAQKEIEKYKNKISGDFGKFISKCQSSVKLQESGLAVKASKALNGWNSKLETNVNSFVKQKIYEKKRMYKSTYSRVKRGSGFIKYGQPITPGKKRRDENLTINVAIYIDRSGSMGGCIDDVFKACYIICDALKKNYARDQVVEDITFKIFAFDMSMHPVKYGQKMEAGGGTMTFDELFEYIKRNTADHLINIIITDAESSTNENIVNDILEKHEGLIVFITNGDELTIEKLSKQTKNRDKLVYIKASANFAID